MKDIIEILANIATILAFIWAVYEFYIKRRFKIKATASPSILNIKPSEYFFDFEVINLSEQSLKRINYLGIWIRRWNTYGQFWEIKFQDVGYQEKTRFSEDIFNFLNFAVENSLKNQSLIDKIFTPKLKVVLRTTMEREIEVKIDEYNRKEVEKKIIDIFDMHQMNR